MSQTNSPDSGSGHKTLAVKLDLNLHAQLVVVAQLSEHTLNDEIRLAIERHVAALRNDRTLTAKAGAVLGDIERDLEARKAAIASLFGGEASPEATEPEPTRPTSRRSREGGGPTQ